VGDKTNAWVSRCVVFIVCKIEIENVAVFPVPDCAIVNTRQVQRAGRTLGNDISPLANLLDRSTLHSARTFISVGVYPA
jgi:hypothetical protein